MGSEGWKSVGTARNSFWSFVMRKNLMKVVGFQSSPTAGLLLQLTFYSGTKIIRSRIFTMMSKLTTSKNKKTMVFKSRTFWTKFRIGITISALEHEKNSRTWCGDVFTEWVKIYRGTRWFGRSTWADKTLKSKSLAERSLDFITLELCLKTFSVDLIVHTYSKL